MIFLLTYHFRMHMDIVVSVITSSSSPINGYLVGDIAMVYPAEEIGTKINDVYTPNDVISSPRLSFLFVTNCPEIDIKRTNNILSDIDVENGDARRLWCLNSIPIFNEGHTTMEYNTFIEICKNKHDESLTITEAIALWQS